MKTKNGQHHQVTGGQPINGKKLALAREFRHEPTPAESKAWEILRDRRLLGLKFRRQQVIDGFIVDFDCAELSLVVELDGSVHENEAAMLFDADRTRHFADKDIRVVRIRNEEVSAATFERLLKPRL
jgi:very-short-patch-repair endonuclease